MQTKEERKAYFKSWYDRNKEKARLASKKWRDKNKEKVSRMKQEWKQNNPQKNLWSNAKYRARRVGIEFNLEISDIVIPEFCPYLGLKLTSEKLKGHLDTHMSVDRIDSSKGYVKGNIEIISYRANVMKNVATKEQLITFARSILLKFDK